MKHKRQKNIEPAKPKLLITQVVFICLVSFLSPLVAGKMTIIPALYMQLLVLACVLIWIIRATKDGIIEIPGGGIAIITGAFFVLLVVSTIDTVSLYTTLLQLANMTSYLLVFLMVAGLRSNRPAVIGILASLLLSGTIVGALGLKEYSLSSSDWRVFSTFFNPDYLAGFMVLILPVILAWYLSRVSSSIALVAGLSTLLVFANIVMSGSRLGALTAIGGLAVFILLALASKSLKRTQMLRLGIILIPAILMFFMLGKPLSNRVASVKAESHSGGFRIYTWKGTARMAEANQINGTGLGTFEIAYPKYALVGYTKLAHNSYLQIAAEAGPSVGVILIILLTASAIPPALSLIRRRNESDALEPSWMPDEKIMLSGLIGGAAASMARNLIDSDWYVTAIGLSFWTVLGAAVALGHPKPLKNLRWNSKHLIVGILILFIISIGLLRMVKAEKFYEQGSALWMEDPNSAVESLQSAIKLVPYNAEYHRRLGNTYFMFARELDEASYADKAEAEMRTAIRFEPANAKTYYQLGRIYEFYPKNDAAIQVFTEAIEKNPFAPELLMALAQRYEEAGRHKDALRIWKRMIQVEDSPYAQIRAIPEIVEPEYIFAHLALGQEFEKNGDDSDAVKEYRLALDRAKKYLDSMEAMGEILEVAGMRNVEMEDRVAAVRDDLIKNKLPMTSNK